MASRGLANLVCPKNSSGLVRRHRYLSIAFGKDRARAVAVAAALFFPAFGQMPSGPQLAYGYLQADGNANSVTPGQTVVLPNATLSTTSSVTFVVQNQGNSSANITAISSTGVGFQISGVPVLPVTVNAGAEQRFSVRFTPSDVGVSRGSLVITSSTGTASFVLEATGLGPQLTYETIIGAAVQSVQPGQTITFPGTSVGERSTLAIRVTNSGNADGRIVGINIQGSGFTVAESPILPVTVQPGNRTMITLAFAPATPAQLSGRLRIGDHDFDLTGLGVGSSLSYTYSVASSSVTVAPNGTVLFSPTAVGERTSTTFTVTNIGNAVGSITSVGLLQTSTVFTVVDVPPLPATIAAGGSLQFSLTFTPNSLSIATTTLRVDTQNFTLSGLGQSPIPIDGYLLEGPSGTVQPANQSTLTLTLSRSYPLTINGVLTLSFASNSFAADPALQFASGGRTAIFTVPANSTRAIFAGGSDQTRFQTGTVAGMISITPAFSTETNLSLPASSGQPLVTRIDPGAPVLANAQVTSSTATSLTMSVTGYSTSRAMTQFNFQFTPVAGLGLSIISSSLNVSGAFDSWFQSSQSSAFGGQFTATFQFSLQGNVQNVTSLVQALQSVSISALNPQGTSNILNTPLP